MTTKPTCFCGGDGKYVDHNCGASFFVQCPHCLGTGRYRGRLLNTPGLIRDLEEDDLVEFGPEHVADWTEGEAGR